MDGVVIDLRGNGGGALLEAINTAGLFFENGPVAQIQDETGKVRVYSDPDPDQVYRGKLIVLVDRNSASASEILAGALKDRGRALIVGERTWGNGLVQRILRLRDGDMLITYGAHYRINGQSPQQMGIQPDILFQTESEENSREPEKGKTISLQHIGAVKWQYTPLLDKDTLTELLRRHQKRVGKLAALRSELQNNETRSRTSFSLNLKKRIQEMAETENNIRTASEAGQLDTRYMNKLQNFSEVSRNLGLSEFDSKLVEAALILCDQIELSE